MIYRIAAAVIAGSLIAGASVAQTTSASSEKTETSCTTTSTATSGSGDEKTSNSMTVGKSAVLPDAGGALGRAHGAERRQADGGPQGLSAGFQAEVTRDPPLGSGKMRPQE
jgi:hypothetical protein